MEKETRMSKYKGIRDDLKEDVINTTSPVIEEVDDEDDDFLSFIPKTQPVTDDTMVTPLDLSTTSKETVNQVLSKDDAHNTRMDIFRKIKAEQFMTDEELAEAEKNKPSLLEQLAQMSPSEDVEELKQYQQQEEAVKEEVKKEKKSLFKKPVNEEPEVKELVKKEPKLKKVKEEIVEEDDEDQDSTLSKVLTYITIGLIVVVVILFVLILKNIIFG